MSTLPALTDADLSPGEEGPTSSIVVRLYRQTPGALEEATFGARVPPRVLAHDHGARGGELLEEPLLVLPFGPVGLSTPSGWTQGLPVLPPAAGLSFAATPKLLAASRVLLRGGVSSVRAEALVRVEGASPRSVSLRLVLRPLRELGLAPEEGRAARGTLASGSLTGAARETRCAVTFADLDELGPRGADRDALLEVWLSSDLPAGDSARLLVLALFGSVGFVRVPLGTDGVGPRAELSVAEVAGGQLVYARHAETAHQRANQVTHEVLGGVPGLVPELDQVDRAHPFEREVRGAHQHRGRRFHDRETGALVSDGAVVRRALWSVSGAQDLDEVGGEYTNARPPAGLRLHPAGTLLLAQGWLLLEGRVPVPQGLRSLLLQVAVAPETTVRQARLWLRVRLFDLTGAEVDFTIERGAGALDGAKIGGATRLLLSALDGPAWQPNASRLSQGFGVWTEDAAQTPLPSAVPSVERLARVSAPVRLSYAERPSTEDLTVQLQFELETGPEGSGTYASGASLLWADVWTPDGY